MSGDRFVVEVARVYQDHTVPVGQRSNLVTDSLSQAISMAKDMMSSRTWPPAANGFRILTPKGDELYRFSD
jgi:hypothetical protein